MREVKFFVSSCAAWAPGIETRQAWKEWAKLEDPVIATSDVEPRVLSMSPMLRRRAGRPAKLALQVAYECLGDRGNVPIVLCSRHGEVDRSVELLDELVHDQPLSPASFSMSVHNAAGGLFSIARTDQANQISISTPDGGVEPGIVEACSLLAEGASEVMLVAYDRALPQRYSSYQDCREQPFGWAWLLTQPEGEHISLCWQTTPDSDPTQYEMPLALGAYRFFMRGDQEWIRSGTGGSWYWKRHA